MHGKDAVIEEILDWRPYDYVTDRTILATPGGPLRLLHTIELEPTTEGTIVHMRFGQAKTPREKAAAKEVAPPYEQALLSAAPKLIEDLEAEMASRNADRDLVTDDGVSPPS